jgi:hypothetical protein
MKSLFITCLALVCFTTNCSNDKTAADKDATEKVGEPGGMEGTEWQAKADSLLKLSPYTLEQMKALLPAQINGAAQTNVDTHDALGARFASADYPLDDSTSFMFSIFDCAGDAGVGIYNMHFRTQMDLKSLPGASVKAVDFKGSKAIEDVDVREGSAAIIWLSGDRFLMSLKGKNMGIDEVKKIAAGLSVK